MAKMITRGEIRVGDHITFINPENHKSYYIFETEENLPDNSGVLFTCTFVTSTGEKQMKKSFAHRRAEYSEMCWLLYRPDPEDWDAPPPDDDYDAGYRDALDAVMAIFEKYGYSKRWSVRMDVEALRND